MPEPFRSRTLVKKLKNRSIKIGIVLVYLNLISGNPVFAENVTNLFVPNDVFVLFNGATKKEKLKYCKTGKLPYEKLQKLSLNPPKRIFGYNSRMDNVELVEGGPQLNEMINLFSNVFMDQLVKQNETLQQIALDSLYQWASSSALLETKSCVNKKGIDTQNCSAWTQSDGQDLSDYMDYHTTQIGVMHLAYGYYFTLASYKPDDAKHLIIKNWFTQFMERNRRPTNVGFGLDLSYYWPKIFSKLVVTNDNNSISEAKKILQTLLTELDPLLLEDGSIKDRTTRGNRGLFYHHASLAELMITIEMARRFNIPISENFDSRIEKAGEIFLNGFRNHSYLDKWAKVAHRGIFTPGKQEFPQSIDLPNGNSWFYIYIFRYPDSPVSKSLQKLLDEKPRTARRDGFVGFGLGCIYAVANEVR